MQAANGLFCPSVTINWSSQRAQEINHHLPIVTVLVYLKHTNFQHQNGRLLRRLLSCLRLRRRLIRRRQRVRCLLRSTGIVRQRQMQPEQTQVIVRQRSVLAEKPTPVELRQWSVRTLTLLVVLPSVKQLTNFVRYTQNRNSITEIRHHHLEKVL